MIYRYLFCVGGKNDIFIVAFREDKRFFREEEKKAFREEKKFLMDGDSVSRKTQFPITSITKTFKVDHAIRESAVWIISQQN